MQSNIHPIPWFMRHSFTYVRFAIWPLIFQMYSQSLFVPVEMLRHQLKKYEMA